MSTMKKFILLACRSLKCRMLLTKTVALMTTAAFMLSSVIGPVAYAATTPVPGVAQTIRESLNAFCLPYTIGKITDAKYLGSKKVVVVVQDLHCHPEVQRNIAKILGILDDRFSTAGPFNVYVEGGIGTIDTSWVNTITNQQVRHNTVETLLNAGRLTGAEYYAIQTKKYRFLQGIEDEKPYVENLTRLSDIMDTRESVGALLEEWHVALERVKTLYYSTGNKRLEKVLARRESKTLQTEQYYKLLLKLAARENVDLRRFAEIEKFLALMDDHRRLPYNAINRQLTHFIATLKEKVPAGVYNQLMEKAQRPNGIEEVYVTLAKVAPGMDLAQFPALAKFFRFVDKNQQLNLLVVMKQERQLISELRSRLSRSRAEREVAFIADFLGYVGRYYENKISADDYAYYTQHAGAFYELWERYAGARLLPSIREYEELFSKFYGANLQRNSIFIKHLGVHKEDAVRAAPSSDEENIFLMNTQLSMADAGCDVSVVVTGGFHTQGLAQMLEEQGVSYVVITPSVAGDTGFSQRIYEMFAREFGSGRSAAPVASSGKGSLLSAADDALALPAVSRELVGKSQPQILAFVEIVNLRRAVASAAAAGMDAETIAAALLREENVRDAYADVHAQDGYVVFTFKDGQELSVQIADNSDLHYSGKHVSAPRRFFNFNNPDGSPVFVSSISDVVSLVARAMRQYGMDTVGTDPDLDMVYYATLLWNALPGHTSGITAEDQMIVDAGQQGFSPSAMLTARARREMLGAEDHSALPVPAEGELAQVNLVQVGLNAGLGSSVARSRYLSRMWSRLNRRGNPKEGAKATDLFFEVEIGGEKRLVSIAEAKLIQRIVEASTYGSTVIEEIVSTGDQDSRTSVVAMYDAVNIFGRYGVPSEWGTMTYRQIAQQRNVRIVEPFVISFFPGPNRAVDSANMSLPDDAQRFVHVNGSGSHGQPFLHILAGAVSPAWVARQGWMEPGKTTVLAITNSDGINNVVDDRTVKWVKDNNVAIAMVTTTRTQLDVKGGIVGVLRKGKTVIKWMVERAVAKTNGQVDIFGKIGVSDDAEYGEKGRQYFNTNTVVMNMSVLIPFLQDLYALVGEEKYLEIISPVPIQSAKASGDTQYWQYEGAMGTSILNIASFIEGKLQEEDAAFVALVDKHGMRSSLLKILNTSVQERFDFFSPIKFAWDFWLQAYSDLFLLNTTTWKLEQQGVRGHLPELEFPDGTNGSSTFYTDVQNMVDAFGHASIVGLDLLDMHDIVPGGSILLKDAVLKGTVRISSRYAGRVDLNSEKGLPRTADGALLMENTDIIVDEKGKVTVVLQPAAPVVQGGDASSAASPLALGVRLATGHALAMSQPLLSIAHIVGGIAEQFVSGATRVTQEYLAGIGVSREDILAALGEAKAGFDDIEIWQTPGIVTFDGDDLFVAMTTRLVDGTRTLLINAALLDYMKNQGKSGAEIIRLIQAGALHENLEHAALDAKNSAIYKAFGDFLQGLPDPAVTATALTFHDFLAYVANLPAGRFADNTYGMTQAQALEQEELLRVVRAVADQVKAHIEKTRPVTTLQQAMEQLYQIGVEKGYTTVDELRDYFESHAEEYPENDNLRNRIRSALMGFRPGTGLSVFGEQLNNGGWDIGGIGRKLLLQATLARMKNDRIYRDVVSQKDIREFVRLLDKSYDSMHRSERRLFNKWMRRAVRYEGPAIRKALTDDTEARAFNLQHNPDENSQEFQDRAKAFKSMRNKARIARYAAVTAAAAVSAAPLVYGVVRACAEVNPFGIILWSLAGALSALVVAAAAWGMPQALTEIFINHIHLTYNRSSAPKSRLMVAGEEGSVAETPEVLAHAARAVPAAVSPVSEARKAAVDFVSQPIDHFPGLQRGVYAMASASYADADIGAAVKLANETGAQVVLFTAVDDEVENQFARLAGLENIRYSRVDTSAGSVTIVAVPRMASDDDAVVMNRVLEASLLFRSNRVLAQEANGTLDEPGYQDNVNGLRFAVLELRTNPSDPSVLARFMQDTSQQPVIVRRDDVDVTGSQIRYDGIVDSTVSTADLLAQLNEWAVYKNSNFTAPAPMVAAISAHIHSVEDIEMVVAASIRSKQAGSAAAPDTILFQITPAAGKDQGVAEALKKARQTLQMAGVWMGVYVEVTENTAQDTAWIDTLVSLRHAGAAMVYLNNESASEAQIMAIHERLRDQNPDVIVRLSGNVPRELSSSAVAMDANALTDRGAVLATHGNIVTLSQSGRAGNASLIILDEQLYGEVLSPDIGSVTHISPISLLKGVIEAIQNKRTHDPAYQRDRGRRDALRGTIDPTSLSNGTAVAEVVDSLTDIVGQEKMAKQLREALKLYMDPGSSNARLLLDTIAELRIGLTADDASVERMSYLVGFIEGVLEAHFASEPTAVELTEPLRAMYANVRLQQFMAGDIHQPGNPFLAAQVKDTIKPVNEAVLNQASAEVVMGAAWSAAVALQAVARETTDPETEKAALAAIIELLRLYGDRAIKQTVFDETAQVVPGLVRDMLGAA